MSHVITASVVLFYTCFVHYGWTAPDQTVEYIYHTQQLTWNKARQVCLNNGGDLAKIDSQETRDTLRRLSQESYPNDNTFFNTHFWIGLVEQSPTIKKWVIDCSDLSFTSNYAGSTNAANPCFRIKGDEKLIEDDRSCDDTFAFLCERHKVGSCNFEDVYRDFEKFSGNGIAECRSYCAADKMCKSVMYVSSSTCYKLGYDGLNQTDQLATISTKYCEHEFIKDETRTTQLDDADTSCSVLPTVPTIVTASSVQTSQSSTISPSPTSTPVCSTQVLTVVSTVATPCMSTSTPILSSSCPPVTCSFTSTVSLTPTELQQVLAIAEEISKNITIDARKTSAYLRSLKSVSDHRTLPLTVGTVVVACILVPVALIVISDVRRFYVDLRGLKATAKITKHVPTPAPTPTKQLQKAKKIYIA